jgi:hypothetical protein
MCAVRYLAEQAHLEGVKHFFGMQSGGISPLFNELYDYPYITTILSRHEQGATFESTGRDSPGCDQEIQERVQKAPCAPNKQDAKKEISRESHGRV